MPKVYWKSVEIGDPIPPLTRQTLSRSEIVVFSVNAGELSPLHLDEEFARQAGYGSISAPGLLGMSLATEMVERWLENGRLIGIATRFQKLVWPGDVLTAKGVVVRKYEAADTSRIDCDVWVQNQSSDIVLKGTAACLIHADKVEEKRRKGRLPEITLAVASMPRAVPIVAGASKTTHQPAEGRQGKRTAAKAGKKNATSSNDTKVQPAAKGKSEAGAGRKAAAAGKSSKKSAASAAGTKSSVKTLVKTAASAGRKALARAVTKGSKKGAAAKKSPAETSTAKAPKAKSAKAKDSKAKPSKATKKPAKTTPKKPAKKSAPSGASASKKSKKKK